MKAVVLTGIDGPKCLRINDVTTPCPLSGEVRVKLMASALNRRDYWMTRGRYPGTKVPCIPGSDGAGIVDAVGEGVDSSLIGREVILYPARAWGENENFYGPDFRILGMPDQGTFAELICTPAEDIYDKPAHLGWEQACSVPLAGLTAWRAVVTQAEVQRGQKILVTGAGGGVSTFAILWCLQLGVEVYVSSGNEGKIKLAKAMGVAGAENYKDPDCYKKLREQSGGFHAVIDSAGGDALNSILETLLPGGRYVFFGSTAGIPPNGLPMGKLFFNHIRIQGTTMGSKNEFNNMLLFLNRNKIKPVIDSVYPLSAAVEAYSQMEVFGHTGKIILLNN